eukprot:TRINITY_DN71703_c2_g1_i1.p5 TRINITY_DN71703_c2_g1~~TRINITY_DN71703_c2_g1_i1.p5  ORF type:complete len:103 (+),score=6.71 TRINITY_DN71703_c2_g1_i1:152-460(+)
MSKLVAKFLIWFLLFTVVIGQEKFQCGPNDWRGYLVPDGGFHDCCVEHDKCYKYMTKSQKGCDDDFYDCMLDTCWSWDVFCKGRAKAYYKAVQKYGHDFYGK